MPDDRDNRTSDVATSHRAAAEAAEEAFFTDRAEPWSESEVDPELVRLPRPRRRRHPIISAAVIGLSVYLMVFLRHDLIFYFQPSEPTDVGHAVDALKRNLVKENTFITVHGAPDRKHALILQGRFTGYDSFFRLLQTSNRIWVQTPRKKRTSEREVSYTHSGRVVRFDRLPYLEKVHAHFAQSMTSAHDIDFDALARAKEQGQNRVADRRGESIAVRSDQLVWINATFSGEWIVKFSKRDFPSAEKAKATLAAVGLPFVVDDERSRTFWRFVALAKTEKGAALPAAARAAALKKHLLASAKKTHPDRDKPQIVVTPRQVSYTARWEQLDIDDDTLVVDSRDQTLPSPYEAVRNPKSGVVELKPIDAFPRRLKKSAILHITVGSAFRVPKEAVVILTNETPRAYWHYLGVYLLLTGFLLYNLVALISRFRPPRKTKQVYSSDPPSSSAR